MARWVVLDIGSIEQAAPTRVVAICDSAEEARKAFESYRPGRKGALEFICIDRLLVDYGEREVALFAEREAENG